MSLWFIVWFILSVALLYFLGWTILVLQRQKKSWKAFAKKYKLRYTPNSFMESPAVNGVIDGYRVNILMGEHQTQDARRARKLSAIEINLETVMPADGALGSADMVPIIQEINLKAELKPEHRNWDDSYIAMTDKKAVMNQYLTQERLEVLTKLMKVKNSAVILIFRDEIMLLRLDTPDPLDKPQRLDKLVKKMIETAKVLEAPELSSMPVHVEEDDSASEAETTD